MSESIHSGTKIENYIWFYYLNHKFQIIKKFIFDSSNWVPQLFYYSLPCLKGILHEEYHQHYALLVGGIMLLSGRSISPEQLETAGNLLMHLVEMYDAYYGK